MIQAVIFDMGGTLLRFARPGSGSWRELETPGIRSLYRYLIEQGHPIVSHEEEFVEAMFARLAEGWEQSTGGHINLRAVDWRSDSSSVRARSTAYSDSKMNRQWSSPAARRFGTW